MAIACSKGPPAEPLAEQPAPTPGLAIAPDDKVGRLEQLSNEYEALQREITKRNEEIEAIRREWTTVSGDLPPDLSGDMTAEMRALLEAMARDEQLSVRGLAAKILELNAERESLTGRVRELEAALPFHHRVVGGERHERIFMQHLVERLGYSERDAWRVAARVNLVDNLLVGHEVWVYAHEGTVGTWVSQGSAAVSPRDLERRLRDELVRERDTAVASSETLAAEVAALEKKRKALMHEIDERGQEATALFELLGDLQGKLRQAKLSARYLVGSMQELKASGVVRKGAFGCLRLGALNPEAMLELEPDRTELLLEAGAYGLAEIGSVRLLPEGYEEGLDYRVSVDSTGYLARVKLLDPAKFRRSLFVVVLE